MAREYRPWPEWELKRAQQLASEGVKLPEIAAALGTGRTDVAVRLKLDEAGTPWGKLATSTVRTVDRMPMEELVQRIAQFQSEVSGDRIPEWLDNLRPVQLPAPPKSEAVVAPGEFTLVASDQHFPTHCPRTQDVFLEVVRQLKPRRVILNGDTVDLLAVSRYPKDQRHAWTLRDEVTAFHEFLHELHRIGNAWGIEVIETEANHSGNGTASRWHRYLSDRVPHLYAHDKAKSLLAYETWFYPEWSNIRLADHVVIADDLLVLHGDIVRKHAAYSARAHGEKWHSSVMHGHTHRMGSSVERVPAVGTRPDMVRRSYETGCMCNLNPSYVSAPNWSNGFAIVAHDAQELNYGVELVSVIRGAACVAALGQTVRAS